MNRNDLAKLLKGAGYRVELTPDGLAALHLTSTRVNIHYLDGPEQPDPDQIWRIYNGENNLCIVNRLALIHPWLNVSPTSNRLQEKPPVWFRMLTDAHEGRVYVYDPDSRPGIRVYHLHESAREPGQYMREYGPLPEDCLTRFHTAGKANAQFADGVWWEGWQPNREEPRRYKPPDAFYTPADHFRGDDPYIRFHFENDPRTGREWGESTYASGSATRPTAAELNEALRRLQERMRGASFRYTGFTAEPNPASPSGAPPPPPPKRRSLLADHYDTVGAPDGADFKTVQAAFRKKAKTLHPDVNKSPDAEAQMLALNLAYQALEKALKR